MPEQTGIRQECLAARILASAPCYWFAAATIRILRQEESPDVGHAFNVIATAVRDLCESEQAKMKVAKVQLGCEVLSADPPSWLRSARLGLLSNQASVDHQLVHVSRLIRTAGGRLHCLFSPQHGFSGEKQANMVESSDGWDDSLSIPVISLYGEVRQPTREMLDRIDVLVIDLQDVGTRVYTYATTMGLCLEAAAKAGCRVVILDRPNPIGGNHVEGNVLKSDCRSFVGRYGTPMRHGLTIGELARYIVKTGGLSCEYEIIPMRGWERGGYFSDTDLHWVYPSPNMPTSETALLYPGMVLLEGTNVSEGRGTTLPFHLFGAPYLDQEKLRLFLRRYDLEGLILRPVSFEPVFDKWRGEVCHGFQIHITDREVFRPYRLGLAILQALLFVHGESFQWLPPPYEYEWEKLPIDILLGDGTMRHRLATGEDVRELEQSWRNELADYRDVCADCLIYAV